MDKDPAGRQIQQQTHTGGMIDQLHQHRWALSVTGLALSALALTGCTPNKGSVTFNDAGKHGDASSSAAAPSHAATPTLSAPSAEAAAPGSDEDVSAPVTIAKPLAVKPLAHPFPKDILVGASTHLGSTDKHCNKMETGTLRLDCTSATVLTGFHGVRADLKAASPDAMHMEDAHDYIQGGKDCKNELDSVKPGGSVYKDAHVPGREVMVVNVMCDDNWSTLAYGHGNTAADVYLKQIWRALNSYGIRIITTYWHEPENDVCKAGEPKDYRAASEQAYVDLHQVENEMGYSNIEFDNIQMGSTYVTTVTTPASKKSIFPGCAKAGPHPEKLEAAHRVDTWMPPAQYVDGYGIDGYSRNGTFSIEQIAGFVDKWMHDPCPKPQPQVYYHCNPEERKNKPINITELGWTVVTEKDPSKAAPAAVAQWIDAGRIWAESKDRVANEVETVSFWSGGEWDNLDSPKDKGQLIMRAFTHWAYRPWLGVGAKKDGTIVATVPTGKPNPKKIQPTCIPLPRQAKTTSLQDQKVVCAAS